MYYYFVRSLVWYHISIMTIFNVNFLNCYWDKNWIVKNNIDMGMKIILDASPIEFSSRSLWALGVLSNIAEGVGSRSVQGEFPSLLMINEIWKYYHPYYSFVGRLIWNCAYESNIWAWIWPQSSLAIILSTTGINYFISKFLLINRSKKILLIWKRSYWAH